MSSRLDHNVFRDDLLLLKDEVDQTKKVRFQLSSITTGNTRTLTVPDASGTIALTSDLSSYQPLDDVLTDLSALAVVANNEFIVGTGAGVYAHESGSTARTSLGLGDMALQNKASVDIDGGAIDGVALGTNSACTYLQVDGINLNADRLTHTDTGEAGLFTITSDTGIIWFDDENLYTQGSAVLGHTTTLTSGVGALEVIAGGSGDPHTGTYIDNYCNNVGRNPALYFRKSLSDTIGTQTTTTDGTDLGQILFFGVDDDAPDTFNWGASILVEQHGAAGVYVPTRFLFRTSTATTAIITGLEIRPAGEVLLRNKLAFTNIDLNEYIDSLAFGYMDYGATIAHRFNTTDLVVDTINHRMGIGTASPQKDLHISSTSPTLRLGDSNATNIDQVLACIEFGKESGGWTRGAYIGISSSSSDNFTLKNESSGGHIVLDTTGTGKVGIKTATPDYLLEVDGTFDAETISINDGTLTFPTSDGNADEIMKTDGSGTLSFVRMPKSTYAELSDSTDQTFSSTGTAQSITFNTNDELVSITHSTSVNPENITIDITGVYYLIAQPQIHADAGGAGYFHMWLQKDTGGGFADIVNSNIEITLASNDERVGVLAETLSLDAGDIIRLRASVGDIKIELDAQTPGSEPAIPSIIFTMFMVGT